MITEKSAYESACSCCLLLQAHYQFNDFYPVWAQIDVVSQEPEHACGARPAQVRIDQLVSLQETQEFVVVTMNVTNHICYFWLNLFTASFARAGKSVGPGDFFMLAAWR